MTDQEILDKICGLFGVATSTVANQLVDTSATFQTRGVVVGDLIINRTDRTSTIVLDVTGETNLTLKDDIFTVGEEYLVAGHLEKRWRFSKEENLLNEPPLKEELDEQVGSALGEINAHPPRTTWTLDDCYGDIVGGRRSLLIVGVAKNVTQLILNQWVQEGFNSTLVDPLPVESKVSEYESLYGQLENTFNERLEKLKTAKEKYIKGARGTLTSTNILSQYYVWRQRW